MNSIMVELAGWNSFYMIIGSASGALIGLQFVVQTLLAQKQLYKGAAEIEAAFGTPTILHFVVALLLSAFHLEPLQAGISCANAAVPTFLIIAFGDWNHS